MLLSELFDPELLREMRDGGYIRAQTHPTLPLTILNYTEKAQWDNVWNDVTNACRGLIYNTESGEVLARPFPKFHNYGQDQAAHIGLTDSVVVTDKLDGSLGILYPADYGYAVATRGSFTSDQALHATKVWQDEYSEWYGPLDGITMLFEIIYPENRIVLDYSGLDDLVYLGAISIETGEFVSVSDLDGEWPWLKAETFPYETLAEALAAPQRPNAEGLVIWCPETDARVKLKQEDYVKLHRIVTGLNARVVWEYLKDGRELSELLEPLPDEFRAWAEETADDLLRSFQTLKALAREEYEDVRWHLDHKFPAGWGRKEFAAEAVKSAAWRAELFLLLDGKSVDDVIWKRLYPEADWSPTKDRNEGTA